MDIRSRLKKCCVGIAGCGGLGSNCAVALARAGVGRLIVADFDQVSAENLDRQYYFLDQIGQKKVLALKENIKRIDAGIKVEANDIKLDKESVARIFTSCPVIVEAFDLAAMKEMIVAAVLERLPDAYLVVASGLAGYGHSEELRIQRFGKLIVIGDQQREVATELPPLAPRVGIVAHLQANQVLQLLLDELPGQAPDGQHHQE
jgi:sulfur carrier protein ThiS adenylyltransferase